MATASTIPTDPDTLRTLRKRYGLSQYEVARRSGLSRSFISDMEAGRRQPRLLAARALAETLGVEIEDLCDQAT